MQQSPFNTSNDCGEILLTTFNSQSIENRLTSIMLFTSGLIGVFAFLQVYTIQAVLPLVIKQLHASVLQAGNAVGASVLAVALMSPFLGLISDYFGRKILIVGSVIFIAIPTILMAYAQSIQSLTLLRFFQGLGVPGITVVAIAYIGEEFSGKNITSMLSAYVSGSIVGGFLGRFIFGYLCGWLDWNHAFLVMGITNIIGGFLIWYLLPSSQAFIPTKSVLSSLRIIPIHLKNNSIIFACLLGMSVLFTLVGSFTYITVHLEGNPFNYSLSQLSNIFSVYLIGFIITPIASRIIQIYGSRKTIICALSLTLIGLLLTLNMHIVLIILG